MSAINFQKTYFLGETYDNIKQRAIQVLHKYLGYPGLITLNDSDRSVTFSTEKLIPASSTNRPRVMLLFSNPHPHSVHQGMFLSPNTIGRENLFWPVMEEAGWITFLEKKPEPGQLAEICLKAQYQGPFELIFYSYYAFPTDFPEDILRIFGMEYFRKVIEPEAMHEFMNTVKVTDAEAVVTFNKGIFNLVSNDRVEHYVDSLIKGEIIQSQIKGMDRNVHIFLTFPTGWRYHKEYRKFRKASLDKIRKAISSETWSQTNNP